ncbi:MAG: hypothetical protein J3K34DRAFT_224321 [Monoraphidium minutum]|nr:MAG: hypothetical protein J3K34DRAFT_224321 [Monoraphidium minutum]
MGGLALGLFSTLQSTLVRGAPPAARGRLRPPGRARAAAVAAARGALGMSRQGLEHGTCIGGPRRMPYSSTSAVALAAAPRGRALAPPRGACGQSTVLRGAAWLWLCHTRRGGSRLIETDRRHCPFGTDLCAFCLRPRRRRPRTWGA